MAIADQPLPSLRNRLLAALPPGDVAKLWPQLEPVELEFRKTLQRPDEPAGSVYFPEVGYVSRLASMEDGDSAEIGLIGPEGMTGLAVLLGADRDSFELLVQVPGTAMRMDATAFRKALDDIPSLRPLLNRYALAHFEQVARTGACNGRHHIDQRLARWLLMSHDRTGSDEFPMTHEFMSMMLGVRRAGVITHPLALEWVG
ncbi:Crp/Fnr family transcriptional regulator [Belnapia rosea]|uniref:Crp/Fnr family transcriptional regulator n=1 Tax=Belnapia rosea TaxID=938405 RepID=UPI000888F1DC|nr:Crp/Fnr family transcriptional regulator [Belnapia rosea]SDB62856.1 cAMP-binding domain of CRP or a regulatory subunit of cAMP-dependent protein kinases [Belnapia rosea]